MPTTISALMLYSLQMFAIALLILATAQANAATQTQTSREHPVSGFATVEAR